MTKIFTIVLGSNSHWCEFLNQDHLNNSNTIIFLNRSELTKKRFGKLQNSFKDSRNYFLPLNKSGFLQISKIIKQNPNIHLQVLNLLKYKTTRSHYTKVNILDWINDYKVNNLIIVELLSFLQTKNVFKVLKQGGSIVNVSSFLGVKGSVDLMAYAASKAALINLTKSLAQEFNKFSIRVNVLIVGKVEFRKEKIIFSRKRNTSRIQDVLELIGFLLSNKSKSVNGQEIIVDAFN